LSIDLVAKNGDVSISYDVEGPASAPALLLANSIGSTRNLWARQLLAFSSAYRVIRYDARGHGRSSVMPGEYTIEQLGQDALAVLDAVGVDSAHICGISLGGLTAMWLGIHAVPRVKSLVLANTAARIGSVQSWTERIALVREHGMAAVAERAMPLWFSKEFHEREADTVNRFRTMLQSCSPNGYLGCCGALRDADLSEMISSIRCPVLAVAGTIDTSTPVDALRFIHERISGSRMVTLDAAHLSNVEQANVFTSKVMAFLGSAGRQAKE
jgi:3-oxoadipate enol-lactonase